MTILKLILASVATISTTLAATVKQTTCNVLALSGGGAFGAVEMGVLDNLITSNEAPNTYDIVTGISAGGLNAGFLSYYDNVTAALPDIYQIFSELTTASVYTSDILGILDNWSIYNTTPLEATLTKILNNKVPSANVPLTMIGASNTNTSALDVFIFGDKSPADKVRVLLATSAIPFAFPPRWVNGSLYVDGGVISNELLTQVLGEKPCQTYDITFIDAYRRNALNPSISGFFSYTSAILKMVWHTFDSQLAQLTKCPYPKGTINACYPTAPALDKYSSLDFDHGAELYALGKESHECFQYDLC
jgi:hypothetical protein